MSRPIRVAHLVCSVGSAGVESHLMALLAAFDPGDVEPVLFVPGPGPLVDRLRDRGLKFEYGAPTRKLAFAEAYALAQRWSGAFELVHAHGPRAIFWAALAARRARISLVATIHELRWQSLQPGPKRSLWIALEQWGLGRARHMIVVSGTAAAEVRARRPEWHDRITVVQGSTPMLLDPDLLPRAAPTGRGLGPMRLITVGRLEWGKGYDILFDSLALVAERGVDFTLLIVGQGTIESELRALAARLGLESRVLWEGSSPDIVGLLAGSHAFVTATRAEALPLAILEAMAVGLPVIAPAVGGMIELIVDGESGILIEPEPEVDRAARIAHAIVTLAGDPDRAALMGAAAALRARGRFSPARMAAGVTDVYRRVLAHPHAVDARGHNRP